MQRDAAYARGARVLAEGRAVLVWICGLAFAILWKYAR